MTISHLADLKLAVIEYHKNANEYAKTGMARDACFTSFNSLMWKRTGQNQMLDTAAEIKSLLPQRGTEIIDVKLEKLLARYELMEEELETLTERHEADKEVYHRITGEHWSAKPKRTHTSDGLGLDARLAKFAA